MIKGKEKSTEDSGVRQDDCGSPGRTGRVEKGWDRPGGSARKSICEPEDELILETTWP